MKAPVARELYGLGLRLSLLSYNHFIKEPAAASTFAIMSNSHPADLPKVYCLNYELIHLERQKNTAGVITF